MRPDFSRDFEDARRCLPHMKQIIGHHLITEAPASEDREHNTDLIVLDLKGIRVACRVRDDEKYRARYGGQFTIRSTRPSGARTELSKLVEGWGDFILYGFARKHSDYLSAWVLGDLNVFRLWWSTQLLKLPPGEMPGIEKANGDGSSCFRGFRYADLPSRFIVAQHGLIQAVAA